MDIYRKRFAELQDQMNALPDQVVHNKYRSQDDIDPNEMQAWHLKVLNLLEKSCGRKSVHYVAFSRAKHWAPNTAYADHLKRLGSIFGAAREDYEGGYLRSSRSLVQAEVFDSELEQARELLQAGYKSPAAVVAGVVLETALRELCGLNGITYAKVDKMNADLTKAGVYNKNRQKQITHLAGIRNSAAHGKPEEFTEDDVKAMIHDVERFLASHL